MIKSNVPFGIAGWLCSQAYATYKGIFEPLNALISLALIVGIIMGLEQLVYYIMERKK